MDAAVFFAAALLISIVLVRYAELGSEHGNDAALRGSIDAGRTLEVLLRSSIGQEVVINLDSDVHVSMHEDISSCLAAEACALRDGRDSEAFHGLNDIIYESMRAAAGYGLDPFLTLIDLSGNRSAPMIAIPGEPPNADNAFAASAQLPGPQGEAFLVVLVLCPAFPPELPQV